MLLAGTLAAVGWLDGVAEPDQIIEAVPREYLKPAQGQEKQQANGSIASDSTLDLTKLQRPALALNEQDPFAAKSWYVPPPPPPPAPPPTPTAPPLPFKLLGILEDGNGKWTAQLAKGNDFKVAGPGETLDNVYKLEGIDRNKLVFTYLPLSTRQTLTIPLELQ